MKKLRLRWKVWLGVVKLQLRRTVFWLSSCAEVISGGGVSDLWDAVTRSTQRENCEPGEWRRKVL